MTRRQRRIERLGGIPDTSPEQPKERGVLEPEDHGCIDKVVEVTATFYYDHKNRINDQRLEVETPGVELTDDIRRAASREMDHYEF